MFVVSVSRSSFMKIIIPAVVVLVGGILIFSCISGDEKSDSLSVSSVNVSDTSDVLQYISTLGWDVSTEPDEIREIIIPSEFDDVYSNYNEIQISQGFDLSDYAGERVKRWTFTVTNYPGYENEECVKINILVYETAVIGGDVCSVELDGFMHGLTGEENG